MAPGYFFVSPYQQLQNGIYIYDNDANLIYSGFGSAGPGVSHSPQICNYKGEVHLCFYQGEQMLGWGHGHGIIMDKHYRIVRSIQPTGTNQASSDMHEFKLINDGKRALMTQYLRSVYDLCDWDLCDGLGYIQQGIFQEVDVESGETLFTWRSLDHVHPSESYVAPASTEISGDGRSPTSPWDYFHINSIDKNGDGDYLISARHVSAIYKISGKDGRILWRLGGAKSDFKLADFSFSFQHDARFISDTEDETIISLFDNGSNGFNTTQPFSSGLIVKLDHLTRVARVIHQVESPGNGHLSRSQGSYQILPNGNEVMGWGSDAFWSEHTKDGEVVFYGMLGTENVMNYRVHKFNNWVGIPLTKPAMWTYSQNGFDISGSRDSYEGKQNTNVMFIYVSWNGHTQITKWTFHCSSSENPKSFKKIGEMRRNGFETIYRHKISYRYCYAQATDESDHLLGTTDVVETFVPAEQMRNKYCDELACRFIPDDETRELEHTEEAEDLIVDIPEDETDADELEENGQKSSGSPQSGKSTVYVISWASVASIFVALALFAARNYIRMGRAGTNASSRFQNVLLAVRRDVMGSKANYESYHPVQEDSDEEVLLGQVYEEADGLMLRRNETEGIKGQDSDS